jgi:hypothetical protein
MNWERRLLFVGNRLLAADGTALETMQQPFPPGPRLFFGDVLEFHPTRSKYFFPNFGVAYAHIKIRSRLISEAALQD